MNSTLEQHVHDRAGGRCEYCRVPRSAYIPPFQIDHVIARQHGGATTDENLALACFHCNLHKGPNIASLDPQGRGQLVALFNPRTDQWSEHFRWSGAEIVGMTSVGRATLHTLNMNDPAAVAVRESLMQEGVDLIG